MKKENLAFSAEDIRRMVEWRYNRSALATLSDLTNAVALLAALAEALERADASCSDLKVKILAVAREGGETSEAREAMIQAGGRVTTTYRFVRGEVERGLLNPPPEAMPDAETMSRRGKCFSTLFALTEADFNRLTPERKAEVLEGLAGLASQPHHHKVLGDDLAALIAQRFPPVAAEIEVRRGHLQQEVREDRTAYAELFEARATYDREHAALALLVEAALTRAGRLNELGRYVRAQDPAYRARLQSGQSVKEEEGVEEVTGELGGTPESIVEPS